MKVLVIENMAGTGLGQLGDALSEARADVDVVRPYRGEAIPSAASYDALILLGGGQNALDDDNSPWFPATLDLIREFQSDERSVLGICLGSQLLARANGAENKIGGHYEFGWHGLELTDEAASDPVFGSVPKEFPAFLWHDDHFSLPKGASRLASTPIAENHAFRVGRAAYGALFHFEADRKLARSWSQEFSGLLAEREPGWNAGKHQAEAEIHGPQADAVGLAIARAWVATIKAPTNAA